VQAAQEGEETRVVEEVVVAGQMEAAHSLEQSWAAEAVVEGGPLAWDTVEGPDR